MVYFLGWLEVCKGYFSIQVCGKRGNTDNHRAISVISIIGKVYIWKNYLSSPLCQFYWIISIFSKNQNPDSIVLHSIVTALLEACNIDIGNVNTVAFLDLKKAFDTVSHDILMSKYVFIVYHGHVTHKCFFSYLDNHTQKCLVSGSL